MAAEEEAVVYELDTDDEVEATEHVVRAKLRWWFWPLLAASVAFGAGSALLVFGHAAH